MCVRTMIPTHTKSLLIVRERTSNNPSQLVVLFSSGMDRLRGGGRLENASFAQGVWNLCCLDCLHCCSSNHLRLGMVLARIEMIVCVEMNGALYAIPEFPHGFALLALMATLSATFLALKSRYKKSLEFHLPS